VVRWASAPLNKGCPASLLTNEAASRPYSIDAAVWLAFVAVNGVCMHTAAGPVFEDSKKRGMQLCQYRSDR